MDGSTPLNVACWKKRDEIALFLIHTERDRVREEGGRWWYCGGAGRHRQRSYNMEDSYGKRPAFWTKSTRVIEELLTLDDFEVTDGDGGPLLWRCARDGLVSERVAIDARLAGHYLQSWKGILPLEAGDSVF